LTYRTTAKYSKEIYGSRHVRELQFFSYHFDVIQKGCSYLGYLRTKGPKNSTIIRP
jgi:hypothetical protein